MIDLPMFEMLLCLLIAVLGICCLVGLFSPKEKGSLNYEYSRLRKERNKRRRKV